LKTSESTWTQRWSLYSANKKSRTIGPAFQKFIGAGLVIRFHSKSGAREALEIEESFIQDQAEFQTARLTWCEKGRPKFESTRITRKVAPKLMEIKRAEWQSIFTGRTFRKKHG